jgi:hypothetical protein
LAPYQTQHMYGPWERRPNQYPTRTCSECGHVDSQKPD